MTFQNAVKLRSGKFWRAAGLFRGKAARMDRTALSVWPALYGQYIV